MSVSDMQTAVLRTLREQDYHDSIHSLPLRWMKCIKSDGEYFEGRQTQVDCAEFGLELFVPEDGDSSDSDTE